MTYVTGNLHGDLNRFHALLDKIGFTDDDLLYVLGDTVDYGEDSMGLLIDLSMRPNVYPVAGEHDLTALRMLNGFSVMLRDGTAPNPAFSAEMMAWVADGGSQTLEGFRELDDDMREGVLDYLSDFSLYEEVSAGDGEYLLVHAGIDGYTPDKPLDGYPPEAFFVPAPDGARYLADGLTVVAHQPTKSGKIEHVDGVIRIDCGARHGGALACLCLENKKEFYV